MVNKTALTIGLKAGLSVFALGAMLSTGLANAESPDWQAYYADAQTTQGQAAQVLYDGDYALGVVRYDLDDHTEILGWQVAQQVYIGRQDGLDAGLTVVWQIDSNQVSLSKDGLRLTRRF